jgi:hypothetical protein
MTLDDEEKRALVKTPEWIELAGWGASRPNLEFEGGARYQVCLAPVGMNYSKSEKTSVTGDQCGARSSAR